MTGTSSPASPPTRFRWWRDHPVVGFLGTVASVVSLILYLISLGNERPAICWQESPDRTVVVNQSRPTRLSVLLDSSPITTDVTASRITIWNAGKQSVRPTQVLREVRVHTSKNVPILEAVVRRRSRDETGAHVIFDSKSPLQATVKWDILEKDDGLVLQITYAGSTSEALAVDGVVEGQGRIRQVPNQLPGDLFADVFGVTAAITGLIFVLQTTRLFTRRDSWASLSVTLIIWLVILGMFIAAGAGIVRGLARHSPPAVLAA